MSTSSSAPSALVSTLALAAASVAVLSLTSLHLLRPDLSPPSHMISEYALGAHGWAMTVCFAAFSASSAALLVTLWPRLKSVSGRIGLGFLSLAAIGLGLAALFPMDPASTPPEAMSLSGRLHGVSFMIGVPGEILAVLLLSLALRQQSPRPKLLVSLAALVWISLGTMVATLIMAVPQPGGVVEGFFGIPNRTFMLAYAAWLMVAAWPHARLAARGAAQGAPAAA
ncbi:hypothetical protein BE21_55790 [Sorangium cellulosum]|uniref:DUF998 domain-containing protein n=1 Tax=Sorangium cellulosum TaxID=56 RepID=A0A150TBA9_SORCE|nr:hypothetical protein BE21_55790 [Sorangium cellulosum]